MTRILSEDMDIEKTILDILIEDDIKEHPEHDLSPHISSRDTLARWIPIVKHFEEDIAVEIKRLTLDAVDECNDKFKDWEDYEGQVNLLLEKLR